MRSSDFYMIRMSQSRAIRKTVGAGSTIDMEALRNVHHQMYVLPQLSYQAHLDRTREQQVNMARRFRDLCFVPKTPSAEAVQDAATAETRVRRVECSKRRRVRGLDACIDHLDHHTTLITTQLASTRACSLTRAT